MSAITKRLAEILIAAVVSAQLIEIGIQVYLGVFKPQEHFAFFTTWGSMMSALCAAWLRVKPDAAIPALRCLLGNAAVSAIIIATVYWGHLKTPGYWFVSSELLLHGVVPLLTVLLCIVFQRQHPAKFSPAPLYWVAVPLLYAGFVIIVGAIAGWYPYDFLNVSQHGWGHTSAVMSAMLLGAIAIAFILDILASVGQRRRLRL